MIICSRDTFIAGKVKKGMDKDEKPGLGDSLLETITDSDATDAAIDLIDIGLDKIFQDMQNETLEQVPVVKTLYSIIRAGLTVRDYFFLKKLLRFVSGFSEIDENLRKQISKAVPDKNYRQELGEQLINALDRFDQLVKTDALFKLLIARSKNEIEHSEFLRYIYALERIDFNNIQDLRSFCYSDNNYTNNYYLNNFAFVGFLKSSDLFDSTGSFEMTDFGKKFLEIIDG